MVEMISNWDVSLVVFQKNVEDLAKVASSRHATLVTIQPVYGTVYWPVNHRTVRDDDHPALEDFLCAVGGGFVR